MRVWSNDKMVHSSDVIMGVMASQITAVSIVYATVCSGTDQRKHQRSGPLAFVRGIHRWPVNSLHKGSVTWKMFPFAVVMTWYCPILELLSHEAFAYPVIVLGMPKVGSWDTAVFQELSSVLKIGVLKQYQTSSIIKKWGSFLKTFWKWGPLWKIGVRMQIFCVDANPDTWCLKSWPRGWFNIKMLYQYRKSHCGDKTILRPSYLHNGISYTGKTASLYWIRALVMPCGVMVFVNIG